MTNSGIATSSSLSRNRYPADGPTAITIIAMVGTITTHTRMTKPDEALYHLLSWLSGGIEVCLVLHFFGHDIGLGTGMIIESLGQAAKAVGFAVPGAIGVQEGGYVVVCRLLGIAPEIAIASR